MPEETQVDGRLRPASLPHPQPLGSLAGLGTAATGLGRTVKGLKSGTVFIQTKLL